MVDLYQSGKSRVDIIREYDLTPSTFDKWVKQSKTSGSFSEKDNLTPEQKELIQLRKELKNLEMENDILKQAALIFGPKRQVISANKHKYSISAMCRVLNISRQTYYYKEKKPLIESEIEERVEKIFQQNKKAYGARKIKKALSLDGINLSRRKIRRIMRQRHLVSVYTKARFKVMASKTNESPIKNQLNRNFVSHIPLEKIVTDLTYVRVGNHWHYVCLILDLFNREIIGFSCGPNKDVELVKQAFYSIPYALSHIQLFHTDRGKEFDNYTIDSLLQTFGIERSLSRKGNPWDNAVAESTYKSFKAEFVYQNHFSTMKELSVALYDYVHWWNHFRLHGALDYSTPLGVRAQRLAIASLEDESNCDNREIAS
ncbi:IS3 family transposase [Vagococcus silagei]|uniref:IS3 family transposase n=1 Tax=Vagococcus silagei TaxID=2508885 RepID=UPI001EF696C8|nr:IS3 family transposase [Vagococcus silagei]